MNGKEKDRKITFRHALRFSMRRCTDLFGTPTMFVDMLNHPRFAEYDYSSLQSGSHTIDTLSNWEIFISKVLKVALNRESIHIDAVLLPHLIR